jgi:hypothetical protein
MAPGAKKAGCRKRAFLSPNSPLAGNGGLFVYSQNVIFFRQPLDARSSRRKLEAEWHQRLKRARAFYEEKAAVRKQMLAERSVWPINRQPDPDGRFALNLALQEESAARTEYMRVLRIFTRLILQGTPPEEDPDS